MRARRRNTGCFKFFLFIAVVIAIALFLHGKPRAAYDFRIKVVEIDPKAGFEIRPELASSKLEQGETFSSMTRRLKPYAAINGTYYDENTMPLGDVLINGKLVNRGGYRHAVAISRSGKASIIHRKRRRFNWRNYRAGLSSGPRLVHEGKIALDPVADGFSPISLRKKAWRSGIGIKSDGKVLLVTVIQSMTLAQFAQLMLDLGAVDAINLDGGGACALYKDGHTLVIPSLPMSNLLVVYKKG